MSARGKILVIRGGAIGDFILTLPVLAALRRQFPDTRLEILGYPHIAGLAVAGGLADAVRPIEARKLATFFARGGELSEEMKAYFRSCDVIISYLYDPDEIFQENVGRCTDAQFITGPHRPDDRLEIHATQCLLKPLERLAIFDADSSPALAFAPSSSIPPDVGESSRWVALHPGSGSERKNWPEAKWRDLMGRLVEETDRPILLVGGEAEGESLERLAAMVPPERLTVFRQRPLTELAERLLFCRVFVGHDSGITHLAAALGKPCLVLWGDTIENVWRPQGASVEILRHNLGLVGITVEEVMTKIDAAL